MSKMTTEVKRTVADLLEDITERLLTGMVQADGARLLAERAAKLLDGQPTPPSLDAALIQCGLDENEVECIFKACQSPDKASIREDNVLMTSSGNSMKQPLGASKTVEPKIGSKAISFSHEENQQPATFWNTLVALDKLGVECRYDEFHDKMLVSTHSLENGGVENLDNVALMIRHEILSRWKFDPRIDNVVSALTHRCLKNTFDPVKDYLAGLRWDGVKRLDRWLSTHLGAEDNPLNRAIGRKMLIAAVRRVREPGCKFDQIIVMDNSQQGAGKSTAIRILAGDENFSDQEILLCGQKEQQELLSGVWFYELGELSGLGRADLNKLKTFVSRQVDRARPAYGRSRVDRPRRCIFIGTTNDSEYLRDPTGNRRFWPFTPGTIDLQALRRDRDQLLAEAAAAEASGETLTLPEELWPEMEIRQTSRLLSDTWEEELAGKLANLPALAPQVPANITTATDEHGIRQWRISSQYLLTTFLGITKPENRDAKRLALVMRKLGWKGPEDLRFNSQVVKGYTKPV